MEDGADVADDERDRAKFYDWPINGGEKENKTSSNETKFLGKALGLNILPKLDMRISTLFAAVPPPYFHCFLVGRGGSR